MALKTLLNLPQVENNGSKWVDLDDFSDLIKKNHLKSDGTKLVKKSNILRQIQNFSHDSAVCKLGEKTFINFKYVLKYVFLQGDNFDFCNRITSDIERMICNYPDEGATATVQHDNNSLYDLYKEIAVANFRSKSWLEAIQVNVSELKEPSFPLPEYKPLFSTEEWTKIEYFEKHFATFIGDGITLHSANIITRQKWEFFNSVTSAYALGHELHHQCQKTALRNLARRDAGNAIDGITLTAACKTHRPQVIEELIGEVAPKNYIEFIKVYATPCIETCVLHLGLHLFIELAREECSSTLEDVSTSIRAAVNKEHSTEICDIVYLLPGALPEGICQRYSVRDLYYEGKIADFVSYVSVIADIDMLPPSEMDSGYCSSCFSEHLSFLSNPLRMCSFNVLHEWLYNVPLPIQVLIEQLFINPDSLRRAGKNTTKLVHQKLARLYTLFDTGLNVINRKYVGFLQSLNSDELLINNRSLSTVFSVGSQYGVCSSLQTADSRLKQRAQADMCYYNTYIKEHPLLYRNSFEQEASLHNVSLRQCHLILYMDNLVRLSIRTDPGPGESITQQICTLPLTLKGVPKDAAVADSWHSLVCLHSPGSCKCKDPQLLTKEDFNRVLVEYSAGEQVQWDDYQHRATWGMQDLFRKVGQILPGVLEEAVEKENETVEEPEQSESCNFDESIIKGFEENSVGGLNESLQNLSLHDLEDCGLDESLENEPQDADNNDEDGEEEDTDYNNPAVDDYYDEEEGEEEGEDEEEEEGEEEGKEKHAEVEEDPKDTFVVLMFDDNVSSLYTSCLDSVDQTTSLGDRVRPTDTTNSIPAVPASDNPEVQLTMSSEYTPPPIICRHPPPATGRDDDIGKLKEVLDEVLIHTGHLDPRSCKDRILLAPDYKIAKNLLKLMASNPKYQIFLPEFPMLHLRKSKITNFLKAYKYAGFSQLVNYMRDEATEKDWSKLVSVNNIEKSTRIINRLSCALHVAFIIQFIETLPKSEAKELQLDLFDDRQNLKLKWESLYKSFLSTGANKNATFSLHLDMMTHADEIVAIKAAERTGGPTGYDLLLAAVKSSLPFSFTNGASSYAQFCFQLLMEHYGAGPFHQHLKQALYTTPHKNSLALFALDTQREIDHRDALKAFHAGSQLSSVLHRMAVVDHLAEVHELRKSLGGHDDGDINYDVLETTISSNKVYQQKLTNNDVVHIARTVKVILARKALSSQRDPIVKNVYTSEPVALPAEILDKESIAVGHFLMKRFAAKEQLFGMCDKDVPALAELQGPKSLLAKVKRSAGTTINRISQSQIKVTIKETEKKEECRKKKVKREFKKVDCLSSEMNACQAVLKPDGSKSTTNKAAGMRKALTMLLSKCLDLEAVDKPANILEQEGILTINAKGIPNEVGMNAKVCTVEFAGVKFKGNVTSGGAYLKFVEDAVIIPLIRKLPSMSHLIICEEKYNFTPDSFKASTRLKRSSKAQPASLHHLQDDHEILAANRYNVSAIRGSMVGKKMVSTYLADHINELNVRKDILLIVDSESILSTVGSGECQIHDKCTTPIKAVFTAQSGYVEHSPIRDIHQRKGEAEMSQADWLPNMSKYLNDGDCLVSYVTSGDIDAIPIHLVAVSIHWPRKHDGKFKWPVFVVLHKPQGKYDIINITKIVELLEMKFEDKTIGIKVATLLCMGGNDFLPRYHGHSHDKVMSLVISNPTYLGGLLDIEVDEACSSIKNCSLNTDIYLNIIQTLYTPTLYQKFNLTFDEVRQISVLNPLRKKGDNLMKDEYKHPQTWMPSRSALEKLAGLTNSQVQYFMSICNHEADLPNFLENGGLKVTSDGLTAYDLGSECSVKTPQDLIIIPEEELKEKIQKAQKDGKKNKAKRVKRSLAMTPQRMPQNKRRNLITSTPKSSVSKP